MSKYKDGSLAVSKDFTAVQQDMPTTATRTPAHSENAANGVVKENITPPGKKGTVGHMGFATKNS